MDGYFGALYTPEDFDLQQNAFHLLATSASHLYHFTKDADEIWRSKELGLDGVIVHDVIAGKVRVSGEWDPSGGWEDTEINLIDGANAI